MTYFDDNNRQDVVADGIDDAVRTLTNPISVFVTRELLAPRRSWVVSKPADSINDSNPNPYWFDRFDFLCGGSLEADLIACHDA